jgi:hypothetical protein
VKRVLADMQSLIAGWSGQTHNSWLTAQTEAVAPDSRLSPIGYLFEASWGQPFVAAAAFPGGL